MCRLLPKAILGREVELAAIDVFLDVVAKGPSALVLEGEAGIGKTTVWHEGVARASRRGHCVLACRPVESEAKLSYAALIDLLDPVLDEVLDKLPSPQRRALEVALLRAEPDDTDHEQLAVSVALVSAVRALTSERCLILAIDDIQWLDDPSARVVEFLVRRLRDERLGLLATCRGAAAHTLPLALQTSVVERSRHSRLGPLGLGPLHQLIHERTGVTLPRPVLVRLERASGGNPFFALEIARAMARSEDKPALGEVLPVPDNLRELVAERIAGLPPEAQDALVVAAAASAPTVGLVERAPAGCLRAAIDEGVIFVEGERVRFTHPLLSEVVYAAAPPERRRLVHQRLADLVGDAEERARHLALAAAEPDEEVASALADAARSARARGASSAAAELAERAVELTPPDRAAELDRRRLAAATYHFAAGDGSRAKTLVNDILAREPSGARRAEALRLLGQLHYHDDSFVEASRVLLEALPHAGDDWRLRTELTLEIAFCFSNLAEFDRANSLAQVALEHAAASDDLGLIATTLSGSTITEFFCGLGIDESKLERALRTEDRSRQVPVWMRPRLVQGILAVWVGQFEEGLSVLDALQDEELSGGEESAVPFLSWNLTSGAVWKGDLTRARRYADAAMEASLMLGHASWRAIAMNGAALVDAYHGRLEEARTVADQALTMLRETEWLLATLWPLEVLAFVELSLENPAGVAQVLEPLFGSVAQTGVAEPSLMRGLPDYIEALVALGRDAEAESLLNPFEQRARALDRPWALAGAARARGTLSAARGDLCAAEVALAEALALHQRIEMPFDLARTLLVLGRVRRRARHRQEARGVLGRALELFDQIGTPCWAEIARRELVRCGARADPTELTATEARVAELAAQGLTNREIAAAAFMSAKTVEANLSRIYRKLGIGSRAELGAHMAARVLQMPATQSSESQ